jgi:hypothetical protein
MRKRPSRASNPAISSYSKNPLMSRMKSTVAAELLKTENAVPGLESEMSALLARVRGALRLIELAFGSDVSDLNATSSPGALTFVTVRFAEIATAPAGIPHEDAVTSNVRVAPGCKAGAPSGPDAFLVSRTRQGGSG